MATLPRLPVRGVATITPMRGNMNGIVMERANGDMFVATSSPFQIHKSTDGGATWTQKYAQAHPNRNARLNFEDSQGNLYFGCALTDNAAFIQRSTDGGETWSTAVTVESDSAWYMIERNNGDLYLNEYNSSNTTHFAYNIWKSTDHGANWAKFYTHPPGPDPSNISNRTIRHFHGLYRDTDDQMYLSMAHGLDVGCYKLNDNGTLGENIGDYYVGNSASLGGGLTSYVQADNGDRLFGVDNDPPVIYKYLPNEPVLQNKLVTVYSIRNTLGSGRESFLLGMNKGRYGVLYAIANGNTTTRPFLLASPDDGVSWVYVDFTNEIVRPTFISVSRSSTPRIFLDQGINKPFLILPDFTKAQLTRYT